MSNSAGIAIAHVSNRFQHNANVFPISLNCLSCVRINVNTYNNPIEENQIDCAMAIYECNCVCKCPRLLLYIGDRIMTRYGVSFGTSGQF